MKEITWRFEKLAATNREYDSLVRLFLPGRAKWTRYVRGQLIPRGVDRTRHEGLGIRNEKKQKRRIGQKEREARHMAQRRGSRNEKEHYGKR